MFRKLMGRPLGVLVAVLAFLAPVPASIGTAQAATVLPGGKANWVVATGYMDLASRNSYRNWVRLGYYTFAADGSVTASHWQWNQQDQPLRVGATAADCGGTVPSCSVRTVSGFTGNPTGGLKGTYGYTTGGKLAVTWTRDAAGKSIGTLKEYWNLETGLDAGGVARISSPTYYGAYGNTVQIPASGVFSTYTANFGIGYGSNASVGRESRATMTQLVKDKRYDAQPYKGVFVVAKASSSDPATRTGIVGREGTGGAWTFADTANPWRLCRSSLCTGWLQPNTSCSSTDRNRVRYLAEVGGGRRNTEEYWCRSLAQGRPCYTDNSHVRPMLQVVDDAGRFQGWVGVEGFTHVNTKTDLPDKSWVEGYWGIFDMVSAALKPKLP